MHVVGHGDSLYQFLELAKFLTRNYLFQFRNIPRRRFLGYPNFLISRGIFHFDEEHEAVELSLGQRIGAFLFDWILSG